MCIRDRAEFEQELERRHHALKGSAEDDDENLLNLLRRAHHAEVFRILARDVEGRLTVEQVADDLSALAEAVLSPLDRETMSALNQRVSSGGEEPEDVAQEYLIDQGLLAG